MLDDTELARIECRQLAGIDMDTANLAAVFEIARLIGRGLVQRTPFEQFLDFLFAFTPQTRLLGRLLFGMLAFAGLGLCTDCIGACQIDAFLVFLAALLP